MTYISPLLQFSLNNPSKNQKNNSHLENVYQNLQLHANDIKPNDAKAKLVERNPIENSISSVGDVFNDQKNFFKAIKTGKMSDNNLGRINNLGMKTGALIIASFLASKAKTKSEAIMQFVGGATFFAVMDLWPKIFINLPARMVHGFNIGQKYISAQGDKKDFFLDNQYLPWDAYSKEELTKIGKRTGIDINSPNGEEKIKRKMQKTALQNRTLWMATAGFATPMITSVVGNYITPLVEKAVVNADYERTEKQIMQDLKGFNDSSPQVVNSTEIKELFKEYENKDLDRKFFRELGKRISLGPKVNEGDFKSIENYKDAFLTKDLENAYKSCKDKKEFFAYIESLNSGDLAQIRGRIKYYLGMLNSALGDKLESVYTKEHEAFSISLLKQLGLKYKDGDMNLKNIRNASDEEVTEFLAKFFKENADTDRTSEKYTQFIKRLIGKTSQSAQTREKIIDGLVSNDVLEQIIPNEMREADPLIQELYGVKSIPNELFIDPLMKNGKVESIPGKTSILDVITKFVETRRADLASVKAQPIICANFESRLKSGAFEGILNEDEIQYARRILYAGGVSAKATVSDQTPRYKDIINAIFDENAFKEEESVLPNIKKIVARLKEISDLDKQAIGVSELDYKTQSNLVEIVKSRASQIYNNKSWARIFVPATIVLAAITLLVQPFFGKIDKEFKNETNKEAK